MARINLLVDVTYTEETGKYWASSYIKNKVLIIDPERDLHSQIAETCEREDSMEFSYNARPRTNIYIDTPTGAKPIGYVYRCKTQIERKTALFTAWVTIQQVIDYPIEIIEKQ